MTDLLLGALIGYAVCVLVPIPWLSRMVLDGWAWVWAKVSGSTTVTKSVEAPRLDV